MFRFAPPLLLLIVAFAASGCVQTNTLGYDHSEWCVWHPTKCDTNGYN